MVDVAKKANTTVATVSRVVNHVGFVSEGLRNKVQSAIEEVGYVPNANARALKTNRSHAIGIAVGDLMNPYSSELANAVTREAAANGYTTFIATPATDDKSAELAVLDAFHRQRVDGVVVATVPTVESDHAIRRLADASVPILVIGRQVDHPLVDSIQADYRRAGEAATQHLLERNHRRIAFVGAELEDAARVTRLRGYLDALEKGGVPVRAEYVVGDPTATNSPRFASNATGYQAAQRLLKLRSLPSAVFARNDQTALGVMRAFAEAGIRVPEDISLVGFDNIPLSRRLVPALTTVSQPTENQGRLASEFLLSRIEQPERELPARNLVLECTLIERSSTAMYAPGRPKSRGRAANA